MSPISRHEWEKSKAPLRYFCLSVSLSVWIDNPRKRSKDTHGPIRSLVRCSPYSSSRHSPFNYSSFMLHMRANRGIISSPTFSYLHTLYSTRNANKNNTVMPWILRVTPERPTGRRRGGWWLNKDDATRRGGTTTITIAHTWTYNGRGVEKVYAVQLLSVVCVFLVLARGGMQINFWLQFCLSWRIKSEILDDFDPKSNPNFDIFGSEWSE